MQPTFKNYIFIEKTTSFQFLKFSALQKKNIYLSNPKYNKSLNIDGIKIPINTNVKLDRF